MILDLNVVTNIMIKNKNISNSTFFFTLYKYVPLTLSALVGYL